MFEPHHPDGRYFWFLASSFIAGVMNVLAGGGSIISFPALLGLGVLPIQANATNATALWPGQLVSLAALRKDLRRDILPTLMGASIVGGAGGAVLLLYTRQVLFLQFLPWFLLFASLIFGISTPVTKWIRKKSRRAAVEHHPQRTPPRLPLFLVCVPLCGYIGYFGAGAGFLVMSALVLFGVENMQELNALKIAASSTANLVAVLTFTCSGTIVWRYCLMSMLLAAAGGWVGSLYARKISPDVLRWLVIVIGVVMASYFFYKQSRA